MKRKSIRKYVKTCKHDWRPMKPFRVLLFWTVKGYSKCIKCGFIRHDVDGHIFNPDDLSDAFKKGLQGA